MNSRPFNKKLWAGLAAVGLLGALAWRLPVNAILLDAVSWVQGAGAAGVLAFVGLYVAAAVLLLPGAALTVAAGFIYGPLYGTLLVSPVSVIAATLAFWLGRTVARETITRRLGDSPRLAAIDRAMGDRGLRLVFLLRLSPMLPFNVLNYGLGLTNVRPRDYVIASFVGMLPGTVLYVYLGSTLTSLAETLGGSSGAATSSGAQLLYWGGLAATVTVTLLITRIASTALKSTLEPESVRQPKELLHE